MDNKDTQLHQSIDDPKKEQQKGLDKHCAKKQPKNETIDAFSRPLGEDDDGYHPWQDRPADNPRWEEDPWR